MLEQPKTSLPAGADVDAVVAVVADAAVVAAAAVVAVASHRQLTTTLVTLVTLR